MNWHKEKLLLRLQKSQCESLRLVNTQTQRKLVMDNLMFPHFTGKAKVDELVKNAGFANYTFVQPPFYFQNLTGQMGPQTQQDGSNGWTLPIDPSKKVIHMADIGDLGKVVAGAFLNPAKVSNGSYLSLATD
ncbi:MAG: NmrA family NAD(P)-binding protein [Saprospirales bacterium]|nr:NmrA family NAD(P)-binding protein [Saprospirales bacterium]